jgi:N-acetylmuramoyl-L-alanine amidase
MKAARTFALVFTVLLAAAAASGAQEKNLLSVVKDLGALLEWDPLRDSGVIAVGQDRVAIGVGADSALVNYRLKVQIDPPERRDGAVWLTTAAIAAISDAMQKDRLAHAGENMRVACILIDPGHGGADGGGAGSYVDGTTKVTVKEKDITLRVGLLLGAMLKAGFSDKQVIFTRENDEKVTLEKRVDVANALLEKTSDTVLFLSIHANTTPFNRAASGYEVWCLPPEYTRTLVDEKAAGKENADIASILNSMREEEISMESNLLAREILAGLDGTVGARSGNRGLRLMDWYVVRNARMPAVLTEVGFVSNEEEAARLADPAYLQDVARGIYSGVDAFIRQFEGNGSRVAR